MKVPIKTLIVCALAGLGSTLQAASQWSLNLDGGVALLQDTKIPDMHGKLVWNTGLRVDVAAGYNINENFSLQLETGLLYNTLDKGVADNGQSEKMSGNLYQIPVLVNAIYKFQTSSKFKPYLGGGAGGLYALIDSNDLGAIESDFTFAYQGIAGVAYELNQNMDLTVAYKFLGTTQHKFRDTKFDGSMVHCIVAGFSWKF
jgi:OOP family OmpA-OmpF porin